MSLARGVDFQMKAEVEEYLKNLAIEYRFGCYHEKSPKACHLLGSYIETINMNAEKAFQIFKTNCDLRDFGHSCHKVGGFMSEGIGCQKDLESAYSYFVKGCENNFPRACLFAGAMNYTVKSDDPAAANSFQGNFERAQMLFKKACDEGDVSDACGLYSQMCLGDIDGIQKNMTDAFTYAVKGCEFGNLQSCVNVSVMYKKGDFVKKDLQLARQYEDRAKEIIAETKGERPTLSFGD